MAALGPDRESASDRVQARDEGECGHEAQPEHSTLLAGVGGDRTGGVGAVRRPVVGQQEA